MADVIYSNIRDLNKRLDSVEAGLKRELQKEAKKPAKVIQAAIVAAIPDSAPLRGMNHRGRTSWNYSRNWKGDIIKPKSVSINFKSTGSKRAAITSLVRVQANSAIVSIIDTARVARSPQGTLFIRALGGTPSRYVWPAVERKVPAVEAEIRIVLDKYAAIASRRLS
jgi:hypothetical protein